MTTGSDPGDGPGDGLVAARDLPGRGRLLAVDPGSVRIGLAVSDPGQRVACPLEVLVRVDPAGLVRRIRELSEAGRDEGEGPLVGVVVGLPVHLDGREGPMAGRSRKLAKALAAGTGLPVAVLDERRSSRDAEAVMAEAGVSARDRRGKVDMVAAGLLLQAYLDGRRAGV